MTNFICGFKAVNSDHCWINGHCAVCRYDVKFPISKIDEILDWHFWSLDLTKQENRENLHEASEAIKQYILEIIGPNLDKDALVQKGDRQGAKEAMAINRHLEGIREKITGKPEEKDNRWWL